MIRKNKYLVSREDELDYCKFSNSFCHSLSTTGTAECLPQCIMGKSLTSTGWHISDSSNLNLLKTGPHYHSAGGRGAQEGAELVMQLGSISTNWTLKGELKQSHAGPACHITRTCIGDRSARCSFPIAPVA